MSYFFQSITIALTCVEVSDFYWHTFLYLFIFVEKLTLTVHLKLITSYIVSLQFYGFCIASGLFLHLNILSDEVCYITVLISLLAPIFSSTRVYKTKIMYNKSYFGRFSSSQFIQTSTFQNALHHAKIVVPRDST